MMQINYPRADFPWCLGFRTNFISLSLVQSLSHVLLSATPWTAACQASLSFTISWSVLKLTPIESMMPSSHLLLLTLMSIESHPLSSPSPPAFIFPSIRVFSNYSVLCIWCPKYWSFSFSISPCNEYSGLISFRIDGFDLLLLLLLFSD